MRSILIKEKVVQVDLCFLEQTKVMEKWLYGGGNGDGVFELIEIMIRLLT